MNILQPWQLLLVTLAGWINRQQQDVIGYIQEENRVLKSRCKGKRIRSTDDERRRLAVEGKVLSRTVLREVALGSAWPTRRLDETSASRRNEGPSCAETGRTRCSRGVTGRFDSTWAANRRDPQRQTPSPMELNRQFE